MTDEERVELARKLFEDGWGGGTTEAPLEFMTDDVVMRDILGHPGAMRGHDAIKQFWSAIAPHLKVMPEEYIEITNDLHGEENKGRYLCGEGMSRLEFRDGKVSLEIDYWNGPQGMVDDWESHFEGRKKMSTEERGARTGI